MNLTGPQLLQLKEGTKNFAVYLMQLGIVDMQSAYQLIQAEALKQENELCQQKVLNSTV